MSGKNEILQKYQGNVREFSFRPDEARMFGPRYIFLAKFIKFPALILSWKFEFMSGKCQGILVNSECMNPEGGVFDNKSRMISL